MPDRAVPETPVNVVSPGAYCVSDGRGDIAGDGHGLFYKDTRHLSKFHLTVGGARPVASGRRERGSRVEFSLAVGEVGVVRRREVGGGMEEVFELVNSSEEAVEVVVSLECAAAFEDVFEVRGWRHASRRGEFTKEVGDDSLRFSYRRGTFRGGRWCASRVRGSSRSWDRATSPSESASNPGRARRSSPPWTSKRGRGGSLAEAFSALR